MNKNRLLPNQFRVPHHITDWISMRCQVAFITLKGIIKMRRKKSILVLYYAFILFYFVIAELVYKLIVTILQEPQEQKTLIELPQQPD